MAMVTNRQRGYGTVEGPLCRDLVAQDSQPVPEFLKMVGNHDPAVKPIPFSRYIDRGFADLERDNVWKKCWQFVCREEDIPNVGDRYTYDIGKASFFVVRNAPHQFKAFYNSCRHRGNRLANGISSGDHVRCGYHGWRWELDGSLRNVPHAWDFPHVKRDEYRLLEVKLDTWGGFIFINSDPNCAPLKDSLGVLPEHFKRWAPETRFTAMHLRKKVRANWKLVAEAFMDSYHAPETHPQSATFAADSQVQYDIWEDGKSHTSRLFAPTAIPSAVAVGATAENAVVEVATFMTNGLSAAEQNPKIQQLRKKGRSGLGDFQRQRMSEQLGWKMELSDCEMIDSIQYYMFPNFFPWMGEFLPLVYQFLPLGDDPETSVASIRWLAPVPASGRPPSAVIKELDFDEPIISLPEWGDLGVVFHQDFSNLPNTQLGMNAAEPGHAYGTMGQYQESRIQHLHELLDRYLGLQ